VFALRSLIAPTPGQGCDLPFRVEVWDDGDSRVDELLDNNDGDDDQSLGSNDDDGSLSDDDDDGS
jgi:hypothetical protein